MDIVGSDVAKDTADMVLLDAISPQLSNDRRRKTLF